MQSKLTFRPSAMASSMGSRVAFPTATPISGVIGGIECQPGAMWAM